VGHPVSLDAALTPVVAKPAAQWRMPLRGIAVIDEFVTLGALTTYTQVPAHDVWQIEFPLLCQTASLPCNRVHENVEKLTGGGRRFGFSVTHISVRSHFWLTVSFSGSAFTVYQSRLARNGNFGSGISSRVRSAK
jgi:hypothetical protein